MVGKPAPLPGPPLGPDVVETPTAVPHGGHTTMSHAKLPPDLTAKPGVHRATTPEMGGPLLVTPAGTTMVATDRLHAHLDQLDSLHAQLEARRCELLAMEERAVWAAVPEAPVAARRSAFEVEAAVIAVRSAADLSERLGTALRSAIASYDAAEQEALLRADRGAAALGAELGPVLRALLPGLLVVGGIVFLGSKLPDPGERRAAAIRQFFLRHPGLITSPRFVEAVRLFASGLDETTSSFLGVPVPVAIALGAAGVTGIRSSSRGLLTVGPLLGLFRETPVQVERVSTTQIMHPPAGAVQRLDRVPEVNQLRIEQYEAPGQPPRYVVYVGPTETFSPKADHEPWDLTSDVGGVGGMDVGAFRASELAMHDAGIHSGDEVQFVGFSEGGLIATMLAGSGEWNAKGLETFGAPAGNIALPDGLSGMAIRNTDDFIPALGGPQLDHHLLQVERRAFADGTPLPTYHAAPAHQRDAYMASAAAVDAATSNAVREQNAALDAFTADYADQPGATVTAMSYHAIRVPEASTPVDPRVAATGFAAR